MTCWKSVEPTQTSCVSTERIFLKRKRKRKKEKDFAVDRALVCHAIAIKLKPFCAIEKSYEVRGSLSVGWLVPFNGRRSTFVNGKFESSTPVVASPLDS